MPEMIFPLAGKRIFVAGHKGLVGSALMRRLAKEPCEILVADRSAVDLTRQVEVDRWMAANRPDAIIVAAAKVGGILANDSQSAEFIYQNVMIAANVISAAHRCDVDRLLYLGSSCIYPRLAAQPIAEEALLTGPLEPTNDAYAIAKIAGIKLCQAYRKQYGRDYISAMPTNLYGPGDNFDLRSSHVLPALIRKAYEAKRKGASELTIWGSGAPRREFLHVDDCADALVLLLQVYSAAEQINVGSGEDLHHPRTHRTRRARRRLRRPHRHRCEQARRRAAQVDERRAPGAFGMAPANRPRGGRARDVPLVSGANRRRLSRAPPW